MNTYRAGATTDDIYTARDADGTVLELAELTLTAPVGMTLALGAFTVGVGHAFTVTPDAAAVGTSGEIVVTATGWRDVLPYTVQSAPRSAPVLTVGVNSYVSVADASAMISWHLEAAVWDAATEDDKARALITATRAIDSLRLVGSKVLLAQPLAFPRRIPCRRGTAADVPGISAWDSQGLGGVVQTAVPSEVLTATALEALARLDGSDVRLTLQAQGVKSASIGGTSETFTGKRAVLLSADALAEMRPFIAGWGRIT